jgi:hypothetical protein
MRGVMWRTLWQFWSVRSDDDFVARVNERTFSNVADRVLVVNDEDLCCSLSPWVGRIIRHLRISFASNQESGRRRQWPG